MLSAEGYFDLVKRHFAFLVNEYGFRITDQTEIGDSASIEFRSDKVYVRVLKTAPDFEPYFVFGRIGIDGSPYADSFTSEDLGMLECCRNWKWQHGVEEPYKGYISQLARLLRDCGNRCLDADAQVFAEMEQRRKELREQHIQEEHALASRHQAKEAWERKDYKSVVAAYDALNEPLSDVEKKRMSYATKKVASESDVTTK